jgi:hypothetical protein
MRPDCDGFAIPIAYRILTSKSVHLHAPSRYVVILSVYGQKRPLLTECAQLVGNPIAVLGPGGKGICSHVADPSPCFN